MYKLPLIGTDFFIIDFCDLSCYDKLHSV
jgi:hypothetical protein